MSQFTRPSVLGRIGFLATGLTFAACGGSGSSGSGSSDFQLVSVSVPDNGTWQINRPIEFHFSKPVDFGTVSLNTISITRIGGAPAAGEFFFKSTLADPNDPCSASTIDTTTIVFQPACPTRDDFADAGLTPGGVSYTLNILGSSSGGSSVRSTSGSGLGSSQTLHFTTPNSTQAGVLFIDPSVATSPSPRLKTVGCTSGASFTYLEIGNDAQREFFLKTTNIPLGGTPETSSFLAPLNFYSDANSQVALMLQIDQPVNPSSQNVSPERVRLEYLNSDNPSDASDPTRWVKVAHTVTLLQNCTQSGALIKVVPTGILPQGRLVRTVLTADFTDIVGNGNIQDQTVATFRARTATDPGTTTPGLTADDVLEQFIVGGTSSGSQQDTTTVLDAPPADWAVQDKLSASFNFGGTGGPGGNFIWHIRALPGGGATTLNTTFQLINGEDANGVVVATQPVVDGQVDVKDLIVDAGAVLDIRGTKPCVIRASGRIDINGKIVLKGANNRGVVSFNSANIPEQGASGTAGGGRGGTGSYLTTQSTPKGEAGYGPFAQPGAGGDGGESGFNASTNVDAGRPAGGGGGSFAIDVPKALNNVCPDQTIVGLDAENGSDGSISANSAILGVGQRPRGGQKGPRPFVDLNPADVALAALDDDLNSPYQQFFHLNDFWGTMLVGTSTLVRGELPMPWAGAGGGGGGDACVTGSFPTTPFSVLTNRKGAGGGGGAGSLTILCLGNVRFGAAGRIDATGGTGGGGENTSGINRVAGGSGAGSGGHVIIQAGGNIDFTACVAGSVTNNLNTGGGIYARGGQGGEGKNGLGGAGPNSIETSPTLDQLPPNAYGTGAACAVTGNAVGTTDGCGGDGGPGVIQLHVSDLTKILGSTVTANALTNIIKPNPIGSTVANVNTPTQWKQLLPIFGRNSKAISKWIPLGATSVPPTGSTARPITFLFQGTNPTTGFVNTTGSTVQTLAAVLTGTITGTANVVPYVTGNGTQVVLDATSLLNTPDDIYIRNPALLREFELRIVGAQTRKFVVASAVYSEEDGTLRITVAESGTPLLGLTGTVSLIPRFFRVSTDGTLESLPSTASIKIEFQATKATAAGTPSTVTADQTPWVTNIALLNSTVSPANTDLRFFRFRVAFVIGIGQADLNFDTPIPSLEFLRVPFRF